MSTRYFLPWVGKGNHQQFQLLENSRKWCFSACLSGPLTNISTKINGLERQGIVFNSKAKKEIGEILWNSTQKYRCAHLELWSRENFISQDQWLSPFVLISLRQWQNGHGSLLGRPHDGKVQTIFCYHGHHDLKLHHDKRQDFSMSILFDH